MSFQHSKFLRSLTRGADKGIQTGKEINSQVEDSLGIKLDLIQQLGIMSAASASHSVAELCTPEEQDALEEWLDS
jgi:hypothetical protein